MVQRERRPSLTERGVPERRKIKLNRERDSREKKDQTREREKKDQTEQREGSHREGISWTKRGEPEREKI